jgi:uncharacterized membrane-anchored protein
MKTSNRDIYNVVSKVPKVTLIFWIIKIFATTVGETGGDALSMTLQLGYAISSLIFLAFFIVSLNVQVLSRRYYPFAYWAVVIATTTIGTTMSDYFDRTLGMGYIKSSIILLCVVMAILVTWRLVVGRVRFENIATRREEIFYWLTILVSNTLGTALGDFTASDTGLGFQNGALVFSGLLVLVVGAYFFTKIPRSILFWTAYVLTRPLGATLGDTLTKPIAEGGLNLGRITSSLTMTGIMVILIVLTYRKLNAAYGRINAVKSDDAVVEMSSTK